MVQYLTLIWMGSNTPLFASGIKASESTPLLSLIEGLIDFSCGRKYAHLLRCAPLRNIDSLPLLVPHVILCSAFEDLNSRHYRCLVSFRPARKEQILLSTLQYNPVGVAEFGVVGQLSSKQLILQQKLYS